MGVLRSGGIVDAQGIAGEAVGYWEVALGKAATSSP
jgi:hypothetical protein